MLRLEIKDIAKWIWTTEYRLKTMAKSSFKELKIKGSNHFLTVFWNGILQGFILCSGNFVFSFLQSTLKK